MQPRPLARSTVFVFLLSLALSSLAADKLYQTGQFLDVSTEKYSKLIGNLSDGNLTTVRKREDALSVQFGDMVYVGECRESKLFNSCRSGNWIVGDPIEFRIDKDSMYLKKPAGGEVKTKIVKRVRVTSP